MMKLIFITFVISVFPSLTIAIGHSADVNYCGEGYGKFQQLNFTRKCCGLRDEQLELIAWYFLRVSSFIRVTEVVPEEISAKRSKFASYFLNDLYKYTGLEYYTVRIDYSYRDQLKDEEEPYEHTYKWHPEYLQGMNRTHFVEDTVATFKKIISSSSEREDDPAFGSIVLSENIETLDFYLNGETRYPFKVKRAHYVLIAYRQMESRTWDKWASSVLSKLWKQHGILNAIIISTCKENNVSDFVLFPLLAIINFLLNSLVTLIRLRM